MGLYLDADQRANIDQLMDWYDFPRVLKTLKALDWKWRVWGSSLKTEVPEFEGTVREHARHALIKSIETGYYYSGGFEAKYEDGRFKLSFIVARAESDYEEGDEEYNR